MFDFLVDPQGAALAAMVSLGIAIAAQYLVKSKEAVTNVTVAFAVFAVAASVLTLRAGTAMDAGNAGSWGFAGLFALVSVGFWFLAFVLCAANGATITFEDDGKGKDE